MESRSESLGNKLLQYVDRVVGHAHGSRAGMSMDGKNLSPEDLKSVAFWRSFIENDASILVTINTRYGTRPLTFARTDVSTQLQDELSIAVWEDADHLKLKAELKELAEAKASLTHADMSSLYRMTQFQLMVDGEAQSFETIIDKVLTSQLAKDLVSNGYVDRNFTLYVSQYYGTHVSTQAMNFIVHNVQPNVMDPYFRFSSPNDIEDILLEQGPSILDDRSMYNIEILDHLLNQDDVKCDRIVRGLLSWGADEQEFLHAYLANGKEIEILFRRLSGIWPRIFRLIVIDVDVEDVTRAALFNAALSGLSPDIAYDLDETIRNYVEANYTNLTILTRASITSTFAALLTDLLQRLGVRLVELRPLHRLIKQLVIRARLYEFSAENLMCALDDEDNLSLDNVSRKTPVYEYVMNNLRTYVQIVKDSPGTSHTIESQKSFVRILRDAADHDLTATRDIAEHAALDCGVSNLQDIEATTWPALANAQRFPMTFSNVSAYIEKYDIDEDLAVALRITRFIKDSANYPEAERSRLAIRILNAAAFLREPELRVDLVQSLNLKELVSVDEIKPEEGPLFGLLIGRKIVDDNEESFEPTLSLSWSTREVAIHNSQKFESYVTSELVPPEDLGQLLGSSLIPDQVKRTIVTRLTEFGVGADDRALATAAKYALNSGTRVQAQSLVMLASADLETETVVCLLEWILPQISPDELNDILQAMGGDYQNLTKRGHHTVKVPNNQSHSALLERLKELGNVSSYRAGADIRYIKVYMKRP
jgi:hypothetical protein